MRGRQKPILILSDLFVILDYSLNYRRTVAGIWMIQTTFYDSLNFYKGSFTQLIYVRDRLQRIVIFLWIFLTLALVIFVYTPNGCSLGQFCSLLKFLYMMSFGMEYLFGQFWSAVLILSPLTSLCPACPPQWQGSTKSWETEMSLARPAQQHSMLSTLFFTYSQNMGSYQMLWRKSDVHQSRVSSNFNLLCVADAKHSGTHPPPYRIAILIGHFLNSWMKLANNIDLSKTEVNFMIKRQYIQITSIWMDSSFLIQWQKARFQFSSSFQSITEIQENQH